ncbi:hypothetical protein ACP70R_037309 [Stipagrostis hirtigluma subsp. patula]
MPTSGSASAIVGTPATAYLLRVDRYSLRKQELPNGQCLESRPFTLGDCSWRICYYPNGARSCSRGYISIFLALDGDVSSPVKAGARFLLLDAAGAPVPGHTVYIDVRDYSVVGAGFGFDYFINKEFLEKSSHLVDDCLTIRCEVSVVSSSSRVEGRALVVVPPSDLSRHLGDLLEAKSGADVTFQVAGETFSAHRCVLAARSPVFKAELFGGAATEGATAATGLCIRIIDDIEAQVFRILLHFIYTDSLPEMTEEEEAMLAPRLLVAADRYGMQRLKLYCAEKLRRHVDLNTVAATLVLAQQHGCQRLKEACIEFLGYYPTLDVVMAIGDGFEHVTKCCPALLKDLWPVWFEGDPIQDELMVTCL